MAKYQNKKRKQDVPAAKSVDKTAYHPLQESAKQPLPSIESFCRSKTFIANSGVNALVASASALFSLMGKLGGNDDYQDVTALRDNLIHEVKAFECAAHTRGYQAEQILIARYAVCATLDETIANQSWGSDWQQDNLLNFFQGEISGAERFFLLVERLRQDPHTHIDLLEFVYLCLSMGFKGQYLHQADAMQLLQQTMDDIYRDIRKVRGDFPHKLSMPYKYFQAMAPQHKSRGIPIWATCVATMLILGGVYFGMNYLTGMTSAPLYQTLAELHSIDHENIS